MPIFPVAAIISRCGGGEAVMDMEACRSLLAAEMNDPVPAGDVLGPPARWGLGYGGTRWHGDQGIHHKWRLLVMPFSPWWSRGRQAICCMLLGLRTLSTLAVTSAYLCFRPLSVSLVRNIFKADGVAVMRLAASRNMVWKEKDPSKAWCMEKCHCNIQCFWTW